MRLASILALSACAGAAPSPRSEVSLVDSRATVPLTVAIVGSPAAAASCMRTSHTCEQRDAGGRRLLVDAEVAVVRWRGVAIYTTRAEAKPVMQFLDGERPRAFAKLAFRGMVGDLGIPRTTADDLAYIGKDAGVTLAGPDGFFIECFDCKAPEIVTALAALGVTVR
jgi:hypothetical protein